MLSLQNIHTISEEKKKEKKSPLLLVYGFFFPFFPNTDLVNEI